MAGKVLIQGNLGTPQRIDSVKALAQFLGLEEALPQVINLANGARLSLSTKRDCYYFTNSRSCSCRAGLYGKICKHRRGLLEGASHSPSEASSLSSSEAHSLSTSIPASHSSKLEEAKASVAQSRAQAREYQADKGGSRLRPGRSPLRCWERILWFKEAVLSPSWRPRASFLV